jgi:hypothetical protein
MKIKNKEQIINIFVHLSLISFGVLFLIFIASCIWIGYDVKENCNIAKSKYEGDCVEALSQFVEDENNPFRLRNSAIWSLGQLGDKKALPALEKIYTGIIPNREPLDLGISQYELKKAINLVNGGLNISSFIWRNKLILTNK